jgi:phage gpG-like protein
MKFKMQVLGLGKFRSLFEGYVNELGIAAEEAAYAGAKIIVNAAKADSFRMQGPVVGSHYNKKLKQEVTDYGDPGEPIPDKLTSRSGILRMSINAQKAGPGRAVVASNVPYAAIHEFGGKTQPHIIKPKYKKWLHWVGKDGTERFSKLVNHPGSNVPPRPYIRPAAEAKDTEIREKMEAVLLRELKWKKKTGAA